MIIFSSSYLIIPYPRTTVVIIQSVPAVIIKFGLPHFIDYVPHKLRPTLLASFWTLAAVVTAACPPNVTPLFRILMTLLASASAAATEVSCLGRLPYYGRSALVGWGIGTGAGNLVSSVAPFVWTAQMGHQIRAAIGYVYYFIGFILCAYYIILPEPMESESTLNGQLWKSDDDSRSQPSSLLIQEPSVQPTRLASRIQHNMSILREIQHPYVILLFISAASQSILAPGINRGYAVFRGFRSFETFVASHNLAFHLGGFLSRSSILILRVRNIERLQRYLIIVSALCLVGAVGNILPSATLLHGLLSCVGTLAGATYVNAIASTWDYLTTNSPENTAFGLSAIGLGESAGFLGGSLVACFIESHLCTSAPSLGVRWCTDPKTY